MNDVSAPRGFLRFSEAISSFGGGHVGRSATTGSGAEYQADVQKSIDRDASQLRSEEETRHSTVSAHIERMAKAICGAHASPALYEQAVIIAVQDEVDAFQ